MRRRNTQTVRRAAFLLGFARIFSSRRTEETALACMSDEERDLVAAARAEADTLSPAVAGIWEISEAPRRLRIMAYMSVPGFLAIAGGIVMSAVTNPACTFADGSSAPGHCMFLDEFNGSSVDATIWRVDDNWLGPIAGFTPELDCARHENVTVSGGSLQLSVTQNARASCPQTWTPTSYYTTNYGSGWPTGQPTSYDVGIIDMRSFQFKYGHMYLRMKMTGGTGPGVDVSWWGTGLQPGGTIHNYSMGFFGHNGQCGFPQSGCQEFDIPNYTHGQTDGKQIIWTHYVDNINSAPFLRTFFGTNYYGADFAPTPLGVNYQPYVNPVDIDPSLAYHVYETDWRPGHWEDYIDGTLVNSVAAAWVSTEPKYMMIWAINHFAPTVATLPQTVFVDYVRIVCPPNVPCEWSGAGAQ